jgi:hypothetical protein
VGIPRYARIFIIIIIIKVTGGDQERGVEVRVDGRGVVRERVGAVFFSVQRATGGGRAGKGGPDKSNKT